MKKNQIIYFLIFILTLFLVSCAPGQNSLTGTPAANTNIAGFWMGLWHGIIAPVTFIISLFNHYVNVYEVHNNGGWYNFGFILGLCISLGGAGTRARKSNR